jgi:hypothetical protein
MNKRSLILASTRINCKRISGESPMLLANPGGWSIGPD